MKSYVEEIEFRATSPRRALPGLEYAEQKLQAISASLKAIQGQLSGVSTQTIFKQSAAQFERNIRAFTTRAGDNPFSKGPVSVARIGRMLGFPDLKDVRRVAEQYARDTEREISRLQRRLDKLPAASASYRSQRARAGLQKQIRQLRDQSFFTDVSARTFQNPRRAGEFFEQYSGPALKNILRGEAALNALVGGAGKIPLVVPAERVVARMETEKDEESEARPSAKTRTAEKKDRNEGDEESARAAVEQFKDGMATIRRDMAEEIVGEKKMKGEPGAMAGTDDLFRLAAIKERAAEQIKALVNSEKGQAIGPGKMLDDAMTRSATLLTSAEHDRQKGMIQEGRALGKTRKALAAAKERGDKEEIKRLESEKQEQEKRLRQLNKVFYSPLAKAQADRQKRAAKLADFERQQSQTAAFRSGSYLGAQQFVDDLLQRGAVRVGGRAHGGRKPARDIYELQEGDNIKRYTVTWGKTAADIDQTTRATKALREQTGWLGSDFLTNTLKVTKWAASVGVLYKSLELARYSFEEFQAVGAQMARLDQIFNKVGGSTRDLTSDVLQLAAANGRDAQEAMESAISWSRLGLNRVQVAEAVRLSLMAANVTQLSAADTTEHLQAILQNYNLTVGDLAAKLGEMVRISNIYNVTNADMLQGVSRTAAVAKQAGLSFEELIGLIGATVGATRQSGANIGNAIKTVITSLGSPALQQKLKLFYGISSEGPGGQKKEVSEVLNEIFVRYQRLDDLQKRAMLFSIGGKFQSSRLSAMLDNYVRAQVLAIDAQLHLNTAEQENLKIIGSLKAQLQGLTAEWDRFVQMQGTNGPAQALGAIATAFRNVLTLMNLPGMNKMMTGMFALLTVASARTLLTGIQLKHAGSQGWIGSSVKRMAAATMDFNQWINATVAGYAQRTTPTAAQRYGQYQNLRRRGFTAGQAGFLMGPARPSLYARGLSGLNTAGNWLRAGGGGMAQTGLNQFIGGASQATRLAGMFNVAMGSSSIVLGQLLRSLSVVGVALGEFLLPVLVVAGAIWLFNKAMDALEGHAEAAQKKLAGFNEEMERAAATANAMGQASELFNTAIKAFSPMAGYGMMSVEQAQRMLEQLSAVTYLNEPDLGKRAKLQSQWAQQTTALYEQGNQMGVVNALEQQRNGFIVWRRKALQDEFEAQQKTIAELTAEKANLESMQKGSFARFGYEGRQNRLQDIDQQMAQAQGKLVQNVQDQLEETDDLLSTDQRVVAEMEKQKTLAQAIADIFSSMPTVNPMEKWYADTAGKSAQVLADQKRMQELLMQSRQLEASDAQKEALNKKLDDQTAALHQKIADIKKASGEETFMFKTKDGREKPYTINLDDAIEDEWNPLSLFKTPRSAVAAAQIKPLEDQLAGLERQKDDLNKRGLYIGEDGNTNITQWGVVQKQMADLNKDLLEKQNELNALKAAQQLRADQWEMQQGGERAKREIAPFDFGRDRSDKMWRQYQALQVQINDLTQKPNKSLSDQVDLQSKLNQQIQLSLDLRQRAAEIEAEISQHVMDQQREFSKSVLGAGPEEMLRKLSAFRLAFDNRGNLRSTSQGQFFAMSSGTRQDFGILNPRFDPTMIELQGERKRVADIINKLGGDKGMDAAIKSLTDKWGAVADSIAARLVKDTPSYDAASETMDRFTGSVNVAGAALEQLATYIHDNIVGHQPAQPSTQHGRGVAVVQGGGLGGGAGFTK